MFKTNEEAEKYFSEKYNKNITFSEIYQDQETLQFHRDILVDGVKTEDKELTEKIRQEQISNFSKAVNQKDWTVNSEDKSFCGTPAVNKPCVDPDFDGTDGACPAYWRGCDDGIEALISDLNELLDLFEVGNYKLAMAGRYGSQNLNDLRDRLSKIRMQ